MTRVLVIGAAAALGLAAFYVLLGHSPLAAGSSGGGGDPKSMVIDSSGIFYRYHPNTDYYSMTSIRNDGLVPITVRGPHLADVAGDRGPYVVGFRHAGGPREGGMNDFAQAEPFTAADVAPHDELWIWVLWHTGPCIDGVYPPYTPGSGAIASQIEVDWSVLGVPRTSWVPLAGPFEIRNIDEDPQDTCADQPS